jgi:hypothetical protein
MTPVPRSRNMKLRGTGGTAAYGHLCPAGCVAGDVPELGLVLVLVGVAASIAVWCDAGVLPEPPPDAATAAAVPTPAMAAAATPVARALRIVKRFIQTPRVDGPHHGWSPR